MHAMLLYTIKAYYNQIGIYISVSGLFSRDMEDNNSTYFITYVEWRIKFDTSTFSPASSPLYWKIYYRFKAQVFGKVNEESLTCILKGTCWELYIRYPSCLN